MSNINYPRIFFATRYGKIKYRDIIYETPLEEFILDEYSVMEMAQKGWTNVQVEVAAGTRYELYFTDPIRLKQDLESLIKQGDPCLAEPGLIALEEVTPAAIEAAVRFLWNRKVAAFFSYLTPVNSTEESTSQKPPTD